MLWLSLAPYILLAPSILFAQKKHDHKTKARVTKITKRPSGFSDQPRQQQGAKT